MNEKFLLQSTRHEVRGFLLCGWLSVLAVQLPMTVMCQSDHFTPYTFTTLAGYSGGSAEGTGSAARFGAGGFAAGVALDMAVHSTGNIYVADAWNNTVRKGYPALAIAPSGPSFGFNLSGPSGQLVVVEASTDLVSWLPIWTNTFSSPPTFTDLHSGGYSRRFYRAHSQ